MLRFLKNIASPQAAFQFNNKQLIFNIPLRFASKNNRPKRHQSVELLKAREEARHSKAESSTRIIEELYFPDHSQMKIQEYIHEKRQPLEDGEHNVNEKVQLNEQDLRYIEDLSSQGTNVTGVEKSFRFPESQEEMSKLIAHTDINDKLLKFYMKHHRQAGRQQIFELLNKLEQNLADEGTVREREEERYRRKVRALQKINKDIEVMFTAIFLKKEEILQHNGFKFLVNNINFKAKQKIYQPYTVLELYHSLLKFDPRTIDLIDKEVLGTFEAELSEHKVYTLAKYLNLLQHFKKDDKETRRLLELTYQALVLKDFSEITKQELLSILIPIKKIGIFADEQLMYKMEPYILKYIKEIETNKLADIFLTYLTFKCGSVQFMQFLMTTLLLNVRRLDLGYLKTVLTLANPVSSKRKDLSFDDLRQGAAHQLMKKFKFWGYGIEELQQVLSTFIRYGLGNENYYDMISVEFMKKKDNAKHSSFMDTYYRLALADLNSQSLTYGCNRQIIECIDELQARGKETVAGLLGTNEPKKETGEIDDILPVDLKLNYYEKQYFSHFIMLMRTMWAYSFFIVRKEQWGQFNMEMWNQGIKQLNNMIKKLNQFTGLIPFSRTDLELVHQINLFARIHGKNSFAINLKELTDANLLYKKAVDRTTPTFQTYLFQLERNYFLKKYKAFIAKYKSNDDYVFEVALENKANNAVTNIFINDVPEYLGHFENETLRPKGHLRLREHYLKETNTPYIEISFDQFSKDLGDVRNMKEGYLEHLLRKHIELPDTTDSLDETDAEYMQKTWNKIKNMREQIPETSLTFEEGLKEVFGKEIEGQAAKDIVFDEQVEEEDVYRDSDSDTEEQQQQQ